MMSGHAPVFSTTQLKVNEQSLIISSIGRGYLFHLISWLILSRHFCDEATGADGRGKGRHFPVKGDHHPRDTNRGRTLSQAVPVIECKP